jgi:hypothetical protein
MTERKGRVVMGKIVGAKKATFRNNVGIGVDAMLETEHVDELDMADNLHVAPGHRFEVFGQLENAILRISDNSTREKYLSETRALERSVGSSKFVERYQQFVSLAADHWTLFAPFIPALTQLLGK